MDSPDGFVIVDHLALGNGPIGPGVSPGMPSSAIRFIHYDAPRLQMRVGFVDGEDYAYDGVEPEIYEGFRTAPSRGRYFAEHIRDRYPYRRTVP